MLRALRTGTFHEPPRRQRTTRTRWAVAAFVTGLALGLCLAPPARAARADLEQRAYVAALIHDAAQRWGLDEGLLLRIAYCESRLDPFAYNATSGAAGVFQFIPTTWNWASVRADRGGASPFEAEANVYVTAWVIKNAHLTGGVSHWRACA